MRTLIWTCALTLFFFPCVAAQDLAQLQKTINENILPTTTLPNDLGIKVPPQELVDACKVVLEAVDQIYALPNLDDQTRHWALLREAFARIVLAYIDAPTHYARLTCISDELEQAGVKNFAKVTEGHVLRIGILLATQTGTNTVNISLPALAERVVLFAKQHSELQMIDMFLREVRSMKSQQHRDRRLAAIAPVFQEFFKEINHMPRANALDTDIRRATLPGKPMLLLGVDLDGDVFNPASVRDKVVLVQFWGTWCLPCKAEMPDLIALYEKYQAAGFEIIGINTGVSGDDDRTVKRFVDTQLFNGKKIPWKILHEGLGERRNGTTVTKIYGIEELPVLILIGRDGKVLHLHPLLSTLDTLVAEAIAPKFDWTEEEKKQIKENERKQQEEIDRQLEQIRTEIRTPQ